MSKKTQTTQQQTQQNTYNQPSMNSYNTLQSPVTNLLQQYMADPAKSGMFNLRLQNSLKGVNQLGQQGASQITQNAIAGGFGGGNLNAFNQSMLAANSRATSAMRANAYTQNLLGQQQLQQQAMNSAMNYRPLQTGATMNGTSTQTVSGLGTWLPQLAGAAIGLGAAAMTGGASMAGRAAAGGGMNFSPTGFGSLAPGAGMNVNAFSMPMGSFGAPAGPPTNFGSLAGPNPFSPQFG